MLITLTLAVALALLAFRTNLSSSILTLHRV